MIYFDYNYNISNFNSIIHIVYRWYKHG